MSEPDIDKMQREYARKKASFDTFKGSQTEVAFKPGPRFFTAKDGVTMFAFRTGAGTEYINKATDETKTQYAEAWREFQKFGKTRKG